MLEATRAPWPETAVVIHTGCGGAQSAASCTQGSASHFMTKPFDNDAFVALKNTLDPDGSLQTDLARRVFGVRLA